MKEKLKNIVNIRSGIYCQPIPFGEVRYLLATDYNANRELIPVTDLTPMVRAGSQDEKHILKKGEILFSAKGVNHYSVVYHPTGENECIASSSFLVLTVCPDSRVIPEYLCWYLNNPGMTKTLKANSKGSAIQSISKRDLEELDIYIPPIEKQKLIVEIDILLKEELRIQNQLNLLKKQLLIKSLK